MADLFNDYKKHQRKTRKNLSIVAVSLALAVLANVAIFKSDMGQGLRASVQDYASNSGTAASGPDLRIEMTSTGADMLAVKVGRPISKATQIRFTVLADPNSVSLDNFFTENKSANIIKQSNIPGVYSVVVELDKPTDVAKDEILLFIGYNRKNADAQNEQHAVINMAEAQFTASGSHYELSNRGIEL